MEFLIHDVFKIPKKHSCKTYNLVSIAGTYIKTIQVQSTQELIHECYILGYYSILYQNEELFMDSRLPPCESELIGLTTLRTYILYSMGEFVLGITEVGSIRQLLNEYPDHIIQFNHKELELSDPLPPNRASLTLIPCCV
jgi:hypothetical protein